MLRVHKIANVLRLRNRNNNDITTDANCNTNRNLASSNSSKCNCFCNSQVYNIYLVNNVCADQTIVLNSAMPPNTSLISLTPAVDIAKKKHGIKHLCTLLLFI